MADFLLDSISYVSLLHSRDMTTRILTAFVTKLAAWNNASFKPRWAAPTVSEKAWPNFFSMLGAVLREGSLSGGVERGESVCSTRH